MQLAEVVEKLGLKVLVGADVLDREVQGGYTGDLLSDVMARAAKDNLWITLQAHINVVAVGVLRDLSGIILIDDRSPDEATLAKAGEENLPILSCNESAFEISGRLHKLLNQ